MSQDARPGVDRTQGPEGSVGSQEPILRADALRNRRVLLDTAAAVLAEKGLNVPVSYIAREAGLGKATVFRRFPTKDSLIAAVIEDRLSQLADFARTLPDAAEPCAALREFIAAGARLLAENRGVCEVMYNSLSAGDNEVFTAYGHIIGTMRTLLTRCQQAGAVRGDVTAEDLLLLQHGIAQAAGPLHDAYPGLWQRYFDLMWDGLRPGGAGELSGDAPVFPGIPDTRER